MFSRRTEFILSSQKQTRDQHGKTENTLISNCPAYFPLSSLSSSGIRTYILYALDLRIEELIFTENYRKLTDAQYTDHNNK